MIPLLELQNLVNEKTAITAVDIGNEGGVCWNNGVTKLPQVPRDQYNLIYGISGTPGFIIAENIHTIVGFDLSSQGALMRNRGILEGIAAAIPTQIQWIEPMTWMRCYTLKRSKHFATKRMWKKHLCEIAKELVPDEMLDLINLQTADAFLIWYYAAHIAIGQPLSDRGQLKLNI